MGTEKITYKFDSDYAKVQQGYRDIMKAAAEADRARKSAAKEQEAEQKRLSKIEAEALAASKKAVMENQKAKSRAAQDAFRDTKRAAEETTRAQQAATRDSMRASERAWDRTKTVQREALRDGRKEMVGAAREHDEKVGGMTARWRGMAMAVGGAIAGMMSVRAVIGVLRDIQDRFDGIAQSADETARAMRPLAVQVAGKEGAGFTKEAAILGAKAGLTPEETGALANTIKSIQGADFQKEMVTGGKLANLGVTGQDVAPIIQAGVTRGMGGQRAAEVALAASDIAPWSVGDVAKALPKTMKFSSLETGLAASATMREAGIIGEQIPYATEAVGRLLSKEESPLAKKFKLKGLDEVQQVQKISAAADASGDREKFIRQLPEKYQIGEEEARGLQALLSRGDAFAEKTATLKGVKSGELDRRFGALMEDPMQRREIEERRAAALQRVATEYGPMGTAAEQERARTRATGMRLTEELPPEVAAAMTDESGRANWSGRTWGALQAQGGGSGILGSIRALIPGQGGMLGTQLGQEFLPSVFGRGGGESAETGRNESTDALVKALEENTAATRENSGATGGGDNNSQTVAARVDRNAGL